MSCATSFASACASRKAARASSSSRCYHAPHRERRFAPSRAAEADLLVPLLDAPLAFSPGVVDSGAPALPLIAALIAIGGTRAALYASLQYATAGFIERQVAQNALIVELGVDTKNLYYYPKSTKMVIGVDPEVNSELVNRMGIETGIPVLPRATVIAGTADAELFWGQRPGTVDAVVTTGCLSKLSDEEVKIVAKKAGKVLKPGGRFIFIESASNERGQKLFDAIESTMEFVDPLEFDGKWATMPLFPHAIGVAIKAQASNTSGEDGERNLKNIRSRRRQR